MRVAPRSFLPFGRPALTRTMAADLLVLGVGLAALYAVSVLGRNWLGPLQPSFEISLSPSALPLYAAYSLLRLLMAYVLSLLVAIGYGYLAATSARAERVLIPVLDVLQSIPVLSFLPGVMLAMVGMFPRSELGVELGSILLIFTGQVWNIAFSFYGSMKAIPRELREAATVYRLGRWQRFTELELPFSAIGLVWNSMMSVAGGWFFLMACESFVLRHRDFRLPGLGSYLQAAAISGDPRAILWGLGTMVGLIVLLDVLIWRPVATWADRFKFEQVEASESSGSLVLGVLRSSRLLRAFERRVIQPLSERWLARLVRRSARTSRAPATGRRSWIPMIVAMPACVVTAYGAVKAIVLMTTLPETALIDILSGTAATFARVLAALLIGALWTVPVGVMIGLNPRLARVAQPLAQIAASVPATALFPIVLLMLVRAGGGMGLAALILMLLGTQWYILFNVIAGAMSIPSDLKESADVFRIRGLARWRVLILPGIFPNLVTGLVTAAGGAWNASIVAEYFHFKGDVYWTAGLGATISRASDRGDFATLVAATLVMAVVVVTFNRVVWKRLFGLAKDRYSLQT